MNAYRQLDERGYVLLPGIMDDALVHALRTRVDQLYEQEGASAGSEFKQETGARRLANLLNKGDVFQRIVAHPDVLPLVGHVLGGRVKLSSVNARSVDARWDQPQPLHCDMAALPDAQGNWVCNTVWMLDDFTPRNGTLRFVPGSHRWGRLPQDALADPRAAHSEQVLVTGTAGSVIVMNAHLWHGGMPNQTERPRTAVHVFYCRRDQPQQQYQKGLLDLSLQQRLSPQLRELLALDDAQNDALAEREVRRSGFLT